MLASRRKLLAIPLLCVLSFLPFAMYSSRREKFFRAPERIFLSREERSIDVTTVALDADFQTSFNETNQPLSSMIKSQNITTSRTLVSKQTATSTSPSSPQSAQMDPRCKSGPAKDVMFLKTHKTGSSTVQNVLIRHAYREKLFVGLPLQPILFKYYGGNRFRKAYMKTTPPGKKVNMLVHHMVFNYPEVSRILPRNTTTYITILRDPATQFESVFHYLRASVKAFRRVPRSRGVGDFVNYSKRYYVGPSDGNFWWFGKNNMVFDLGFNNTNETVEYMKETTKRMDEIFDLVLIAEYFDISLLLLKDLLCWDIEDMVYLSMNARNQSTVEHLTDGVKEEIYEWNKADTALYRYYNKTFWKRVEEYGKTRLQNDLEKLDKLKKKVSSFCVEDGLISNKDITSKDVLKMYNPPGLDITQYKLRPEAVHNETCLGMILPEKAWYDKFYKRQYPRPMRRIVRRPGLKPKIEGKLPVGRQHVGDSRVVYHFNPKNPNSQQEAGKGGSVRRDSDVVNKREIHAS